MKPYAGINKHPLLLKEVLLLIEKLASFSPPTDQEGKHMICQILSNCNSHSFWSVEQTMRDDGSCGLRKYGSPKFAYS